MSSVESVSLVPSTNPAAGFRSDESITAEFRTGPGLWADLACHLLPEKPGAAFCDLTTGSERQCYAWAAGDNQPLASILIELLRGDEGQRVLDFVMRGCEARWWVDHQRKLRNAVKVDATRFE